MDFTNTLSVNDWARTYKEIRDNLVGIPTNLLSERLKCLETDELITIQLYQTHPPRYRYILTQNGTDLTDIFNSLMLWGEKNLKECHKHLTHSECGHSIELQYYCNQCNRTILNEEIKITD